MKSFISLPDQLNQLFFNRSVDALLGAVTRGPAGGGVAAAEWGRRHLARGGVFENSQPAPLEVHSVAAEGVSAGRLVYREARQALELRAGVVHLAAHQGHARQGLCVLMAEGGGEGQSFLIA